MAAGDIALDAGLGVAVRKAGHESFDVLAFPVDEPARARVLASALPAKDGAHLGAIALPSGRVLLRGWGRGEVFDGVTARLLERLPDHAGVIAPSLDRAVELRPIIQTVTGWSYTRDGDEMTDWRSEVHDDTLRVFDPRSGRDLRTVRLTGKLAASAWSEDGRKLWVASDAGLWRVEENQEPQRVSYSSETGDVSMTASASGNVAACWSPTVVAVHSNPGVDRLSTAARRVVIANKGLVAWITRDGDIRAWSGGSESSASALSRPRCAPAVAVAVRADGSEVAWIGADGMLGRSRV